MDKRCTIENCDRPHLARGLCTAHYKRMADGMPMDTPIRRRRPTKTPIEEAFWATTGPGPDGCIDWAGSLSSVGYARFSVAGRWMSGSRMAYTLAKGPIPDGLVIRHTCDRPICVNPEHLIFGTQADNMRDRDERGRQRNGSTGRDH